MQITVVEEELRKISRSENEKRVKQLIFDENFWTEFFMIVKIVTLFIRLLRNSDADEKPALRYVYEGIFRPQLGIKTIFKKGKTLIGHIRGSLTIGGIGCYVLISMLQRNF